MVLTWRDPEEREGEGEGEEDKQAPGESSSSKSSKSEVSVRLEDIYIDPEERSITHDNPLLGERPIVYLQEGGSDKQLLQIQGDDTGQISLNEM